MARTKAKILEVIEGLAVWWAKEGPVYRALWKGLARVAHEVEEVWDTYFANLFRRTANLTWLEARGEELDVPRWPWEDADAYRQRLFRHVFRSTPGGVGEAVAKILNRRDLDGYQITYQEPRVNGTGAGFYTDGPAGTTPGPDSARYWGVLTIPWIERVDYDDDDQTFTDAGCFTDAGSYTQAARGDLQRADFVRIFEILQDARPLGTNTHLRVADRPQDAFRTLNFDPPQMDL